MEINKITSEKLITVLSIDGGGVRGLIPVTILAFLESELQKLDGDDARIADYFDVVAGTNSGGLSAALLTVPDEHNRPWFSADNLKRFFLVHYPRICPQKRRFWLWLKNFVVSKYNGHYLRTLLKKIFGDTKLNRTLTNVVIPTYDIKRGEPTVFSSFEFQLRREPLLNANVSDICVSTLATPPHFPVHRFETHDWAQSRMLEFNLIDGGFIANNPAALAISTMLGELISSPSAFQKKILIISLGTGTYQCKYNSTESIIKSMLKLLCGSSAPLLETIYCTSSQLAEEQLLSLLDINDFEVYYLRIQDDTSGDTMTFDVATQQNLERLVEIGEGLLDKRVSRLNTVTTGGLTSNRQALETNRQALVRFARLLSQNRRDSMNINRR